MGGIVGSSIVGGLEILAGDVRRRCAEIGVGVFVYAGSPAPTLVRPSADGPALRWRTLEWWGAGVALFLQSGALFPLLLGDGAGGIDDGSRGKLRLLALPVYAISLGLLSRHPWQLVAAVRRNLPLLLLLVFPLLSVIWSIGPSSSLRRVIGLLGSALLAYLLAIRFTPHQLLILVTFVIGICMLVSVLMLGAAPHMAISESEMVAGRSSTRTSLAGRPCSESSLADSSRPMPDYVTGASASPS